MCIGFTVQVGKPRYWGSTPATYLIPTMDLGRPIRQTKPYEASNVQFFWRNSLAISVWVYFKQIHRMVCKCTSSAQCYRSSTCDFSVWFELSLISLGGLFELQLFCHHSLIATAYGQLLLLWSWNIACTVYWCWLYLLENSYSLFEMFLCKRYASYYVLRFRL